MLKTKRLIIRSFNVKDAESLYLYAKDKEVGSKAGWNPHKSVEETREIINEVLMGEYTYAICLKEDNLAIGAIGLTKDKSDNYELGYWLGRPFWNKGYVTEAASCLLDFAFNTLKLNGIDCTHFEGNDSSKRVMEKLGFKYSYTNKDILWPITNEIKTEHHYSLEREEYAKNRNTSNI